MNVSPGIDRVGKWALFFALAYLVQGFAQTTGILLQPMQFYFKQNGYDASDLAAVSFWITFPWYIKPVYGLLADFIPLFGYRRRSYLLSSCVIAFAAFALVIRINDPVMLMYALMLTALCTAVGDVMVDALMVEHGQKLDRVRQFQSIQWIAVSVLGVFAAIGGGMIAEYAKQIGDPFRAVQIGSAIAMIGPIILLVSTWLIVREPRSQIDRQGLSRTTAGLGEAVRSKPLIGVTIFVCMFWFQPGLTASMYLHATETLKISEVVYGSADAWAKGGYLLGALLFMLLLGPRLSVRQLAALSVLLYAGVTLGYLALRGPTSLITLSFLYGVCYMICNLTLLSLAAEVCPRRVEAFVFAFLMGLMNFVRMGSDWIGGNVYVQLQRVYDGQTTGGLWMTLDGMPYAIDPLIVISALITLLALCFVPLLPKRGDSALQRSELGAEQV